MEAMFRKEGKPREIKCMCVPYIEMSNVQMFQSCSSRDKGSVYSEVPAH